MKRNLFDICLKNNAEKIARIRIAAWELHKSVGQTYDKTLPYGHHLSMVADAAMRYGHEVMEQEADLVPVVFAAYFHDSMEDARLTYNDVLSVAREYMTDEQAHVAVEIVYALTNDKGKTRAERAGERYYAGIRETPYAPFVKLCDRLANMTYSFHGSNDANNHMRRVYQQEWPHFLVAITVKTTDARYLLPSDMVKEVEDLLLI